MRQKYVCVDIQCDNDKACKCPALENRGSNGGMESNGVGRNVAEAAREAASSGWTHKRIKGKWKDFCPWCSGNKSTDRF